MQPVLDSGFFYNLDGSVDERALKLNCYQCQLYFFAKVHMKKMQGSMSAPFIQDINVCCVESTDGEFLHFGTIDSAMKFIDSKPVQWNEDVFEVTTVDLGYESSFQVVNSLLETGEKIILQTQSNRVPYFITFEDLNAPFKHGAGHVFLLIGHTDLDYIYVDFPYFTGNEFLPFKNSRDIGLASKDILQNAFKNQFIYSRVSVNLNLLSKFMSERHVSSCFLRVANNYKSDKIERNGFCVYYGKSAYERIINALEISEIDIFSKFGSCDYYNAINFLTVLDWQFHEIKNRRDVFRDSLLHYNLLTEEDMDTVNHASGLWASLSTEVCLDPSFSDKDSVLLRVKALLAAVSSLDEEMSSFSLL